MTQYEFEDNVYYAVHILKNGLKFYHGENETMNRFWDWCWNNRLTFRIDYYTGTEIKNEVKKGKLILI